MEALLAARTDIGIRKQTNQDSYCLKMAQTPKGPVVLAIICDGLGGLSGGEIASADLVRAFSQWFETELPAQFPTVRFDELRTRWGEILIERNESLVKYGYSLYTRLGTTFTGILFLPDGRYFAGHVGDSRLYRCDGDMHLLTSDHTVTARAVLLGEITAEEAETHKQRNVLIQCIGASPDLAPDFFEGIAKADEVYMLCSDGFRHKLSTEELSNCLAPEELVDEAVMNERLTYMIDACKARGETDNITSLLVKFAA